MQVFESPREDFQAYCNKLCKTGLNIDQSESFITVGLLTPFSHVFSKNKKKSHAF